MPHQLKPGRLVAMIIGAGVAFGAVYTVLFLTFPLLTGSDIHARIQSAAVVALGFPAQFAFPTLAPLVGRVGLTPFAIRVGLAMLNGMLWTTILLAFWRTTRPAL